MRGKLAGFAVMPIFGKLFPDGRPLISDPVFCSLRVVECDQVSEGHLVDALALRGDEGRDRLR